MHRLECVEVNTVANSVFCLVVHVTQLLDDMTMCISVHVSPTHCSSYKHMYSTCTTSVCCLFLLQVVILEYKSIICAGFSCIMHIHTVVEEVEIIVSWKTMYIEH